MQILYFILIFALGAVVAVFAPWSATVIILGGLLLVLWLMQHLELGLLILVFLYPFTGLMVDVSQVELLRSIPFIRQINAPLVELFALPLFIAWFIVAIRRAIARQVLWKTMLFPGVWAFILFWVSAWASMARVSDELRGVSFKYLFHPLLFFYVSFVVLCTNLLQRDGLPRRVFGTMFASGMATAFIGLISFFVVAPVGFFRATPFAFFGIAPLGLNHNLMAEVLIATAPAGLAFLAWERDAVRRRWIFSGMVFQLFIALLTFSRTAWIVIALETMVAVWVWSKKETSLVPYVRRFAPALLILIPLALVMIIVSASQIVEGSTMTRADQINIAWFNFLRSPWLGQGTGTFIPALFGNRAFMLDYGAPFDAHGIVWKLMYEQGAFGIATFFLFVGVLLHILWKAVMRAGGRFERQILLSGFLMAGGSFVYQLFNTQYYSSKLWVPMGIALGVAHLYKHQQK